MKKAMRAVLAPAATLMGRMRFVSKLSLIGAVFGLAMLGLSIVIVSRISSDIAYTQSEIDGLQAYGPTAELIRAVNEHRRVEADRLYLGDDVSEREADARQSVQAALDRLAAFAEASPHADKLLPGAGALREAWADLRLESESLQPERVLNLHSEFADQVLVWLEAVADSYGLTLDPEAVSYALMDMTTFRLPNIADKTAIIADIGRGVLLNGLLYASERSLLTTMKYRVQEDAARTGRAFEGALAKVDVQDDGALSARFLDASSAIAPMLLAVEKDILAADDLEMTPEAFQRLGDQAIAAAWSLFDQSLTDLEGVLGQRLDELRWVLISTGAACLLTLLVAGYLFAGLVRSLGDALKAIGEAVAKAADGEFVDRVPVSSRDEMREVANGIETVTATFREFAAAQQEIQRRHMNGEVSYRIPISRFRGSYAEIAQAVNELAAQHLATSDQVIGIIEQYALGDLGQRIEAMPGEQARVSDAVESVRERLTAIRDEILQLSAAAARGEFTLRGNAHRFQYAYREMVEGLNQLMANADRGLNEVAKVLSALAAGDLTQKMDGEFQGRFAGLRDDSVKTMHQLAAIVGEIKQSSQAIDRAAKELSEGNSNLASRTESQATSLEETASSIEEMTATVKQNAENARQANQLAIGACDVATRGGNVVSEVVTTMGEISASSKRIADIIGVIDGIAFQTNILALNAAVEAARAGEQGRGFAVVASEVRSLAQRSASAAREIKGLIEESVNRVDQGSELVERAGSTMDEIVASVKRVTDIMTDITAASEEQTSGIEQINMTIGQMDESTQQNAAMVEEASASARSLKGLARKLWSGVDAFVLDEADKAGKASVTDEPEAAPIEVAPAPVPAAKVASKPLPAIRPLPSKPAAAAAPAARKPAPPRGRINGSAQAANTVEVEDRAHWTEF